MTRQMQTWFTVFNDNKKYNNSSKCYQSGGPTA